MTESPNRIPSLPRGPWSNWPLQRIFHSITGLVLLFFAVILALGARQYLLYNQCRQAVAASDRLLFQFTTIKNHLNESLVLAEKVNLRSLGDELQLLDREVSHLDADILVPEGLKSLLPSRVNLIGLEVQLRSIQEQPQEKSQETVALVRALSGINVGLQQFRFGLSDHTQRILLGLHKIIVGALGLIVVLTCTLLYQLNHALTAPILALCRLPGLEGGERCSLKNLAEQIGRLQELAARPPVEATSPEATGPEQLRQQAHHFSYTVLGLVGTELASELTNRLNGILNYTQSLIDLEDKEERQQLRAEILPLLVHEEKKAIDLVALVQRVGHWQSSRPSSILLHRLFPQLHQLLEKSLRTESITLELPNTSSHYEALIPAGDLWLVLITLIDQGRRALNHTTNASSLALKQITLTLEDDAQNGRLHLQLNNSAGTWMEGNTSFWPGRPFCTQLLQLHRAELHEQTKDSRTRLSVIVSYRKSAV